MPTTEQAAATDDNVTRSRLVREATRLFQMRGYHGVGIAEILEAAQAPKGSLYHHFPGGKKQLAIAAIEQIEKQVEARLRSGLRAIDDSGAAINAIAADIAAWFDATGHAQGSILASLAIGLGPNDAEIAGALRIATERIELALTDLFTQARIDEPKSAARELLIVAEGAMLIAKVQRDGSIIECAVSRFVQSHFANRPNAMSGK